MIDTNQINQAGAVIVAAKSQWEVVQPMLVPIAYIVAREISAFNAWAKNVAEWVMGHGGIGYLAWKLIWNPAAGAAKPAGN